jgi:5-(carboxyamino)imidazole ribonucleotide synthase
VQVDNSLPPGSIIGILGGGQLGRMLALAAAELGLRVHIYAPPGDNPATHVAYAATIAAWDDEKALAAFADAVDVVTYEFENIPIETVKFLAERIGVSPGAKALAVAQDRLSEKELATQLELPVASYATVNSAKELDTAIADVGLPAILKTRRLGYDGKGQARIDAPSDADAAWRAIGETPAILERRVPFQTEISVIIARSAAGKTSPFDVVENVHVDGILRTSTVPAKVLPRVANEAIEAAERIGQTLDYVGVLAVEFFVVGEGEEASLLVNEIAPRVHNSGHWTTDACVFSQFDLHIRAVANWPSPEPIRHSDVVMTNLIGRDIDDWRLHSPELGKKVHLYGKEETRPGRKMGHVNRVIPRRK